MVDQIIRPADLPDRPSPVASEKVPVDNGGTVGGASIEALVNAGRPLASQAEAEAGVQATKAMTPLTTKQSIASEVGVSIASKAQGDLADSAVQSVVAGANIFVDASDPQNPIISANNGSSFPENIAALKALDTGAITEAYLTERGKEGWFIWSVGNYSGQVAADPLGGVYVKADAISAGVGCWVRSGADWTGNPCKDINLAWFGYKADDATDNTAFVNAAIAIGNVSGFTNIVVPVGIGRVGQANVITANEVRFVAEGAVGLSIFRGTNSSGMLRWGSKVTPITIGGGLDGLGFYGNSNTSQALILVTNAQEIYINDPVLGDGVAMFLRCGDPGVYSGTIVINNMTGRVPNVATPLIRLVNGSGLFIHGGCLYNQAVQGGALEGRDFVQVVGGSWNTLSIKGAFVFLFNNAIASFQLNAGEIFGDMYLSDNYFDEMNEAIFLFAVPGASIANCDIHNIEMTGKRGCGIRTAGGGTFARFNLSALVVRETKRGGIDFQSAVNLLSITDCSVTQTNEVMSFVGSISGTSMTVTERVGHPGGTIEIGDTIVGPGVTPGTTVTSVPANNEVIGVFGVTPSQTVASASLSTTTGHYSSLHIASGSDEVTISNNSFGPLSSLIGTGYGEFGIKLDGGSNFHISNNAAEGLSGKYSLGTLTDTSADDIWFAWTPTLTSSGGGAFGSASASGKFQRVGNTITWSIVGTITTVGAATGFITASLPEQAATGSMYYIGSGLLSGFQTSTVVNPGASNVFMVKYDSTQTATTVGNFSASGEYQIA